MKKPNPLIAGLEQLDRKGAAPPTTPAPASPKGKARSREGAVQIAAFFPEEVRTQLKMLAAEQRREIQDLLAEGLNMVFMRYGKAEIAPRKSGD